MGFARTFLALGLLSHLLGPTVFAQSNAWVKTGLSQNIRTIVIDKSNHIYAAGNGLYRSADAGVTWAKIENGLPQELVAFGISPHGDLFACARLAVFRSTDQGNSWKLCFSSSINPVHGIAFTPAGDIYVTTGNEGIHHSRDNGNNWAKIPIGLSNRAHTAIDINFGIIAVADTIWGIWEFFEGGDRWYLVNGWMPYKNIQALLVTPTKQILAGTTNYGIYSLPLNEYRVYQANAGLQSMGITDFALAANRDIFASSTQSGVYRSTDDGKAWAQINRGLPTSRIACIAVDDHYRLYAGTINDGLYRRLQLNTTAPAAATLLSPTNNALIRDTSVRLQWHASSGTDSYRVQVVNDTTANSFIIDQDNIVNNYFDLSGFSFNRAYYWRVESSNAEGVNWSSWWKFNLTNATTNAPLPLWPPNDATDISPTATFRWNIVPTATSYSLTIATDPCSVCPYAFVIEQCCISDTLFRALGLNSNQTYYWWVVANLANNSTKLLSLPWKFTTGNAEPSAAWKIQSSNIEQSLHSVRFADVQKGWAVGDSGAILHTENGGLTWKPQNSHTVEQLKSVDFVNAQIGFAAGNNGTILRTNDGGTTWTKQNLNTGLLISVAAINADTVTVASAGSSIFQTFDGGRNWVQRDLTVSSLSAIYFLDSQRGWAAGNSSAACTDCFFLREFHTSDGGENWELQSTGHGPIVSSIFFTSATQGWRATKAYRSARFGNPGKGAVSMTGDAGTSWQAQYAHSGVSFNSVHFVSPEIGTVVGDAGVIFHTLDGGKQWTFQPSGTTQNLKSVYFNDNKNGWIVGEGGLILHTTNGGVTTVNNSFENKAPREFSLSQNFPNPFNPTTFIEFSLPFTRQVKLKIYDLWGKEVKTLAGREFSAGTHKVEFNAEGMASGVYFYRLQAEDFIQTKKMVLVR